MNTLVACDFFTKSVITPLGVKIAYCLIFIHLGCARPPILAQPIGPLGRALDDVSSPRIRA